MRWPLLEEGLRTPQGVSLHFRNHRLTHAQVCDRIQSESVWLVLDTGFGHPLQWIQTQVEAFWKACRTKPLPNGDIAMDHPGYRGIYMAGDWEIPGRGIILLSQYPDEH